METKITSHFLDSAIHSLDLYFYTADASLFKKIDSCGSLEKIIGKHDSLMLKYPIELNQSLFHPKDRQSVGRCVIMFTNGCIERWSGFYRVKHADGGWIWIYSRLNAMTENGSPSNKISGMIMDISSSISTQTELGTLIREAARLKNAALIKKLTPRELMIIKLIVEGQCYKDIAGQLFIQPDTVNKHRKNILRKLGLKNIAMLACFAKETGLV